MSLCPPNGDHRFKLAERTLMQLRRDRAGRSEPIIPCRSKPDAKAKG